MQKCLYLLSITAIFYFSACTINLNQPVNNNAVNQNSATSSQSGTVATTPTPVAINVKTRWSVILCSSRDASVTLSAGAAESDSRIFATWHDGDQQRAFALPESLQNLSSIYFEATGSEPNPVELCVLFEGRPKKRVAFDEGSEAHIISASDDDDNDCRCTQ